MLSQAHLFMLPTSGHRLGRGDRGFLAEFERQHGHSPEPSLGAVRCLVGVAVFLSGIDDVESEGCVDTAARP